MVVSLARSATAFVLGDFGLESSETLVDLASDSFELNSHDASLWPLIAQS